MISQHLVAASSKPLVLAILVERESYGYEIMQRIRELSNDEIQWKEGMLYPVLHRLERQGLIESEWRASDAGRKRKYYRLTDKGRHALRVEKRQWMHVHSTLIKIWDLKPCLT